MARPKKKDGKNISFYMDAAIVTQLHEYADDKGQTLTKATELILKEALDKHRAEKEAKVQK